MRRRLTYANVVATRALFITLGGGAYAAFKLPTNSVGTRQLKSRSVTPAKAGTAFLALPTSETTLGTMTVPAGSYLLQAKVTVDASTASDSECTLGGPFGSSIIWDQGQVKHNAASDHVISLSGVATFDGPQVVELGCRAITGTVLADDARVTAITTGALHGTTPVD